LQREILVYSSIQIKQKLESGLGIDKIGIRPYQDFKILSLISVIGHRPQQGLTTKNL